MKTPQVPPMSGMTPLGINPPQFRYKLQCPKCNRVTHHVAQREPQMQCGDCLMDRIEVVTFQIVDRQPVK